MSIERETSPKNPESQDLTSRELSDYELSGLRTIFDAILVFMRYKGKRSSNGRYKGEDEETFQQMLKLITVRRGRETDSPANSLLCFPLGPFLTDFNNHPDVLTFNQDPMVNAAFVELQFATSQIDSVTICSTPDPASWGGQTFLSDLAGSVRVLLYEQPENRLIKVEHRQLLEPRTNY